MSIVDSLFDTFRETVFVKEDSNLEKQVAMLKDIQKNNKSLEIARDIKLLELGIKGENEISYELKNANLGLYVLRDVTIKYGDSRAQIDYVIISKGYTYLVECKNLIGNIYVDSSGQFQREYEFNGKKIRESIYSPYTQAMRHKDILKKRWVSKNNKLLVAIREKYFDSMWYKPLVVLANSKSILDVRRAPKEVRDNTIRVDQLVKYIENDLKHYDKDSLTSKKNMELAVKNWLDINIDEYNDISSKYKVKDKDILINKLKEFRTSKSKSMNVPAYYVFNDNELNILVDKMPKDIEELKEILSPIKIKCHGEEILKIINE